MPARPRTSSPRASPRRSTGRWRSGGRTGALRAFPRPGRAAPDRRRAGPCARARLFARPASLGDLPGHADATPGPACRQLLPRREGRPGRLHRRRRGDPGPVRRPGRRRDRQRARLPGRAARPRRPGSAGRDLVGRHGGVRHGHRPHGLVQPRGAAHRGDAACAGPPARGAALHPYLPARRRARDRARGVPDRTGPRQRRDGARRGDRTHDPRRAQRHHAGQRNPDPWPGRDPGVGGGHHAGSGATRGARPDGAPSSSAW